VFRYILDQNLLINQHHLYHCIRLTARIQIPQSSETESTEPLLQCSECERTLGIVESTTGGYKLRKSNLSVSPDHEKCALSFEKEHWLACLLLCAMDNKGVRKFNVSSGDERTALKLWIFTPDLTVSSSVKESMEPVRVIKIMWKEIESDNEHDPERLTTAALAEDELHLFDEEVDTLRAILDNSAELLPHGARTFQDEWKVGLLERFTSEMTRAT
jgi:ubiquitin-protein ligase E3 D